MCIGKWVVAMVAPPYPACVGEITGDYIKFWDIRFPWGTESWNKRYCDIYDTKEEAQKAYDDFTRNPNNYAYGG